MTDYYNKLTKYIDLDLSDIIAIIIKSNGESTSDSTGAEYFD